MMEVVISGIVAMIAGFTLYSMYQNWVVSMIAFAIVFIITEIFEYKIKERK